MAYVLGIPVVVDSFGSCKELCGYFASVHVCLRAGVRKRDCSVTVLMVLQDGVRVWVWRVWPACATLVVGFSFGFFMLSASVQSCLPDGQLLAWFDAFGVDLTVD